MADFALLREIYDAECLARTIDDYRTRLNVEVLERGDQQITIRICDLSGAEPDERVAREFLNSLLDLSVQQALRG
jgi:hypothetical protein